jgi:hypothetical protein
MAHLAPTPQELANHLAFLHIDLTDPDFHQLALAQRRAAKDEIRLLLDAAVKARELRRCDTARLARAIQVTLEGGLIGWAIEREGTAAKWLRDELKTLLEPYLKLASRAIGKKTTRSRNR